MAKKGRVLKTFACWKWNLDLGPKFSKMCHFGDFGTFWKIVDRNQIVTSNSFWHSPFYSLCVKSWRMLKNMLSNLQKLTPIFKNAHFEIWPFLLFFGHKNHVSSWKLQAICNLVILVQQTWFNKLGQVMDQDGPQNTNHYICGHTFYSHNSAIFWRENGPGPQAGRPKCWPTGWTLWVNHYLKKIFSKIKG